MKVNILADGEELTAEQLAEVTTLVYIDNDERHVDDLQLITNDATTFKGKTELQVSLTDKKWEDGNRSATLKCGSFYIDDKRTDDTTGTNIIKAAAVTETSKVRQEEKSNAWERINLKELAEELARNNGLPLIYAAKFNPVFFRKEQILTSDIKFLADTCGSVGLTLKYTDNALVIFSKYEQQAETARTFTKGDAEIIDINLHHRKNDTAYGKSCVTYYDPVKKEMITGEHIINENGRALQIRKKVSSTEEARKIAMYALKEKNSKEYTGYIVADGDISLATGIAIELKGWEEYDRKYIVKKTVHMLRGSVYTTKIFFEMAMEG